MKDIELLIAKYKDLSNQAALAWKKATDASVEHRRLCAEAARIDGDAREVLDEIHDFLGAPKE